MANRPGQVFSREQLMDEVWRFPYYSDTTTVTVHIRRLRAKIEPDPSKPTRIETIWGAGYRFRALTLDHRLSSVESQPQKAAAEPPGEYSRPCV